MYVLPITIPLEDDELLSSWIYRTSKANLFENFDHFIRTFVKAKAPAGYQYLKYDGTEEFLPFYLALQSSTPVAELYLKTTCYGGLAPFMTSGQQLRHLNIAFRKTYGKSEFTPKVTPITRELRRCKLCQCEELEHKGFWYYHRAHQLPGVRVCHTHGTLLDIFIGRSGQEFDEEAPFESATPNASDDIMLRYAMFVKEILDAAPDADVSATMRAIRDALKQQGYLERGVDCVKLNSDIERIGMKNMFQVEMERYIMLQLVPLAYPCVEQSLALVYYLFGSAEAFMAGLPRRQCPRFEDRLSKGAYLLEGAYKNNLVQLRHKCGARFCTTTEGFASGWSCPKCDARKTDQAIYEKLIAYTIGKEYVPQTEFEGIDTKVTLLHQKCEKQLNISPSKILFQSRRCECEHQRKKSALLSCISSNGSFELVEYISSIEHVLMRHLECGGVFESNYNYFMADMRCPRCESGVQLGVRPPMDAEELRKRIKLLVGDEYTLESNTVKKGTTVVIRHNKCGNSETYYYGKFLIGKRCSQCRTRYSESAIYELIPYLSNGEYKVLSVHNERRCCIKNNIDSSEYSMSLDYIIQEFTRPTPSPKLPCRNPNRSIQEFLPTPSTSVDELISYLSASYQKNDVLFVEDINEFSQDRVQVKKALQKLMKKQMIGRISLGAYQWRGSNITNREVIFQRYICSQGKQLGYLYGSSFAYELGLLTQEPDRLYITTNKEARLHGREKQFMGCLLYLRGSEMQITDENWMILQFLDFLQCPMKYSEFGIEQTEDVLRRHIQENELSYEQSEPYLVRYPEWVGPKLQYLCEYEK